MKWRIRYVLLTTLIFFHDLVISCGKELNEIRLVASEKSELRMCFFLTLVLVVHFYNKSDVRTYP